jgi:predicted RNA-binding Zn-ribbon protein involved in translation (DUF1610 family)
MAERVAKIECPHCQSKVHAYRDKKGRVVVTTTAGLVAAGAGAAVGSVIGLATGGWGTVATVPFGIIGAVIGGGFGYILGDQVDKPKCPDCDEQIELGV